MDRKRESLGLMMPQAEEDSIDIAELASKRPSTNKYVDLSQLQQISENTGFVSRLPRKKRSRTPYTHQKNFKVRAGMTELFEDICDHLDTYDNETFEKAILALIEKECPQSFLARFTKL